MSKTRSFTAGHAGATDWMRCADAVAEQIGPATGAAFGLLYITDDIAPPLDTLAERLSLRTGIASWIGTVAAGVLAGRTAYFGTPGLAAMALDLPAGRAAWFDTVAPAGAFATADGRPPVALIHGDPRNQGLQSVIDQFQADTGAFTVGGLTSSRTKQFEQLAGAATDGGISGLVLAPEQVAAIGVSQGFRPIGPAHRITGGEGNVIHSLDGEPPAEILEADLAALPPEVLRGRVELSAALVVPGSDRGDFLVRPMMLLDRDGWMAVADPVEIGQEILFCRYDRRSAAQDLEDMAARTVTRAGRALRGAVYVACTGRGPHMFPRAGDELDIIADATGDAPMIGFYAAGEISGGRVHGFSGVLTLF